MMWERIKLGKCCEITSSKRIFYSEYVESGIPFYRSKEIIERSNGQNISEPLYISKEKYDKIKTRFGVPTNGDLLLTSVGTIGIPYIIRENDCFYFKDGNLTWLRNFKENLLPQYLFYWIKSDIGYATLNNTTIGSSQKALTISALKEIIISCPPIEVQIEISNILSTYDNLIENNQKQIKLLEEAAQRLYKEWFVDLRFPGYENTKIIDGVPEGWRKKKISEFGQIITGKTPSTAKEQYYGGPIPFVKISDMHDGVYPITTEISLTVEGANSQKNKFIPKDSIMISCIATVGLVNIAVQPCQTNQQINSIVLNDIKDLYYVYFSAKRLRALLDGVGSNGATMTNVNKSKFSTIEVLYPTSNLRDKFYIFCKPVFDKIFNLSNNIIKLKSCRDRLLPKLMSGELEV